MVDISSLQRPLAYPFSPEDKSRLEKFANLFEIPLLPLPDGTVLVTVSTKQGLQQLQMMPEHAYLRALAEVCSLTARWLYFCMDEHCAITLFKQTDARIARLAELYEHSPSTGADISAPDGTDAP